MTEKEKADFKDAVQFFETFGIPVSDAVNYAYSLYYAAKLNSLQKENE